MIPSISTGFSSFDADGSSDEVEGWYVGLEWSDVFIEGNSFGAAIGSAPNTGGDDENTIWEAFYSMAVTDNITVTPTYFIIDEYSGDLSSDYVQGAYVKTTFTF